MFFIKHKINGVLQNVQGTIFDDALEKKLYENIEKKKCPHAPLMPAKLKQIVDLIKSKLHGKTGTPGMRFNGIKPNLKPVAPDHGDAFLVRVEKIAQPVANSSGAGDSTEQWEKRSESEVNLHVLLQSQFRALNVRWPDMGDSISANDLTPARTQHVSRGPKRLRVATAGAPPAASRSSPHAADVTQAVRDATGPREPLLRSQSLPAQQQRHQPNQQATPVWTRFPASASATGIAGEHSSRPEVRSRPLRDFEAPESPVRSARMHDSARALPRQFEQAVSGLRRAGSVPDLINLSDTPPASPRRSPLAVPNTGQPQGQQPLGFDASSSRDRVQAAASAAPSSSRLGVRCQDGTAATPIRGKVEKTNRVQYQFHDADERNGIFSNFWEGEEITIDGENWKTVEHYFQAQKFRDMDGESPVVKAGKKRIREAIKNAGEVGDTKRFAYKPENYRLPKIAINEGWDQARVPIMYIAVFQKFNHDKDLKKKLLGTGNEDLIETMPSGRHDVFWGAKNIGGNVMGANMLGQILMQVRADLREGKIATNPVAKFSENTNQNWNVRSTSPRGLQ